MLGQSLAQWSPNAKYVAAADKHLWLSQSWHIRFWHRKGRLSMWLDALALMAEQNVV